MYNPIKVFIVEDEALIADQIRRTLEGLGYEVCGIAYDFTSAAAKIPVSDADLCILDINLGDGEAKNGMDLARLIKSTTSLPFIFLTAYNDKETIIKATELQPANFLLKPANPATLFAAIQLAIAREQEPLLTIEASIDGSPDFFYVKIGMRKEKLLWQEVYGMEASRNYVRLFIDGHAVDYPVRGTLSFVLEELVPATVSDRFFRLGGNICLNRKYITWLSNEFIICGGRRFENAGRVSPEQFRFP